MVLMLRFSPLELILSLSSYADIGSVPFSRASITMSRCCVSVLPALWTVSANTVLSIAICARNDRNHVLSQVKSRHGDVN